MSGLTIENTNNKLIFSIDKGNFSESVLLKIMKIARLEYLINKADFKESILELDEELKAAWWQQNKSGILSKENS